MEKMIKFDNGKKEEMDAFLATPQNEGKNFVLVIQEIWGLTDFIRSVVRRITDLGYAAVAPDLYSRKAQKGKFTQEIIMEAMQPFWALSPEKRRDEKEIEKVMSRLSDNAKEVVSQLMFNRAKLEDQMIADLKKLVSHMESLGYNGKRGVIGFCMGGGLAFELSTQIPIDASAIYYGANPKNLEALGNIKGTILGIYAGEDSGINDGLPDLMKAVLKHKKEWEMKLYPGTYHAFFNHTGMSYNEPASKDAWERTARFFNKILGGKQ
ncbi:MAG: dienelactone hydrolase family protein [Thermoplasmataceae archaeon]